MAIAHRDPEQRAVVADLWRRWGRRAGVEHGLARVVRTRESLLVPEIEDATLAESALDDEHLAMMRRLGMQSAMVAPLVAGGLSIGAISFIRTGASPRYEEADMALAEELARRAATAIENAPLP